VTVSRGDVVRVELDPTRGSELRKTRPCVVVQRDAANRGGRTTIVCPLTDASGKRASSLFVPVAAGVGGTTKDSLVVCSQIRAVDRVRITTKLGELPPAVMQQVSAGLRAILDLGEPP
jgi:mRNA interferase MazF